MKHLGRLALAASALPLAGCMTTGTNMHNDFACRAPNGTCAPLSTIDAKAVAGIGASAQVTGGIIDPALPREGRVVTASADGSPPGRTSERTLRVVFPAHIDASGIYHDESSAHAVIERAQWTDGLTGGARRAGVIETADIVQPVSPDSLQNTKLASLDEVIAAQGAQARKSEGQGAIAVLVPSSTAPVATVSAVRTAVMRSTDALALREAAAAATALPVAGLDPNFDTPDVSAAIGAEPTLADHCTGYRPVWWHGHAYRRLRPVPCPAKVASVANAASLAAATSTRSLNLAHLEPAAAPAPLVLAAPRVAAPSPAQSSTSAHARPVLPGASAASDAGKSTGPAPTADPALAAARVSMLTRSVFGQADHGRDDPDVASADALSQLLAGASSAASSGAPR